MKHVAIVEDEPDIRANYRRALEREHYRVSDYPDRPTAIAAFHQQLPDLVIIDIGLGEESEGGFDLCRELRQLSATLPIIFLTARDSELDEISGIRLGADDYLSKDASLHQLLVRIAGLFRRAEAYRDNRLEETVLRCGPLTVEPERMRILWQDAEVPLTVTEFWIVHALARRPGMVKSRQQLMDAANIYVDLATITSHVKRIRRKFRQLDEHFDAIEAIHGLGYRWQVR